MQPPAHVFDTLTAWSKLPASELESKFSPECASTLAACAALLLPAPFLTSQVTKQSFVSQVLLLRQTYVAGSRMLGEAIIAAGEFQDAGNLQAAAAVLAGFLQQCHAPFYRDIASNQLAKIRRGT